MKTPTTHVISRSFSHPDHTEFTYTIDRIVWIVDEGDAWEVWCVDCGYRLGTTTNPEIEGRESDAARLTDDHEKVMHL